MPHLSPYPIRTPSCIQKQQNRLMLKPPLSTPALSKHLHPLTHLPTTRPTLLLQHPLTPTSPPRPNPTHLSLLPHQYNTPLPLTHLFLTPPQMSTPLLHNPYTPPHLHLTPRHTPHPTPSHIILHLLPNLVNVNQTRNTSTTTLLTLPLSIHFHLLTNPLHINKL